MKPLIGINLDVKAGAPEQLVLNADYSQAIQAAGGIPLFIAPMSDADLTDLLGLVSGVIFTGGKDYSPELYGQPPHSSLDLAHSWRQEFDLRLMQKCLQETQKPILGICAGHQLLNVALGGTLIQDLESELSEASVRHLDSGCSSVLSQHEIYLDGKTHLAKIIRSERITVPSSHHQAVKTLGKGLRVSSRAEDGVVESIELPERSLTMGVQWHPERDYHNHSRLFHSFVAAAAEF